MRRDMQVFLPPLYSRQAGPDGLMLVGRLTEDTQRRVSFAFEASYLDEHLGRPVLGQHFEDQAPERVYTGKKPGRAPRFFANLLPEGRMRQIITRQHGLAADDELGLLAALGHDLPGAVVVRAASAAATPTTADAGAQPPSHAPAEAPVDPDEAQGLRFSLAGVQLKLSMVSRADRLTLPARGEQGAWIVKLAGAERPGVIENELSMMQWARAAGFDVPRCALRSIQDIDGIPRGFSVGAQAFVIERYDRAPQHRIHQEDFAQVANLSPRQKYDHVTFEAMGTLALGILGHEGLEVFARRLVLMIACGNADAHLKNWSLLYLDPRQPSWAPLYDQVCTVAWPDLSREMALKMAGIKHFNRVDREALARCFTRACQRAERLGLAVDDDAVARLLERCDETLVTLRDAWRQHSASLPLLPEHAEALRAHWRAVPLLRALGPLGP